MGSPPGVVGHHIRLTRERSPVRTWWRTYVGNILSTSLTRTTVRCRFRFNCATTIAIGRSSEGFTRTFRKCFKAKIQQESYLILVCTMFSCFSRSYGGYLRLFHDPRRVFCPVLGQKTPHFGAKVRYFRTEIYAHRFGHC